MGAAMFKTLERFYGRDDIRFTFVSDEFNGITRDDDGTVRPRIPRTFDSFSEASEENGQSRIYLGIHWSFDKNEGVRTGNQVATFVFDNFLRPRSASIQAASASASSASFAADSGETSSPAPALAPGSSSAFIAPTPIAAPSAGQTVVAAPVTSSEVLPVLPTDPGTPAPASATPSPEVPLSPEGPKVTDPLALDNWSFGIRV
jgi:hypothetical protein